MITVAQTTTINSLLEATGSLQLPDGNVTFAGSTPWKVGTLTVVTSVAALRTFTFVAGLEYIMTADFVSTQGGMTSVDRCAYVSGTPGTKALLTLQSGATQDVGFANPTDIDSNNGQKIFTFHGTVTTTFNWTADVLDILAAGATPHVIGG